MNPTLLKLLPQRLTERSFRRYEQAIAQICSQYPQPTTFLPETQGLRPTTFSCRLRDAMTSFATYKWPSAIDFNHFTTIHKDVIVSHRGNTVIVGLAADLTRPIKAVKPLNVAIVLDTTTTLGTVHCFTLEQKQLISELASKHLLAGPIDITGLSVDDVDWLEDNYDISLKLNKHGNYTIT